MDVFHVVIDTSMLRRAHFRHADFERLLRRSRAGALKIYIPHVALEEQRTHLVEKHGDLVRTILSSFDRLQRGELAMLTDGLPPPALSLWTAEDIDRNSQDVFARFVEGNKIEVIPLSLEHATDAWKIYFNAEPPFDRSQPRESRRKDIPDSWILVAARGIKGRQGRHCALVADEKLKKALEAEGFEIFDDIKNLEAAIDAATSVVRPQPAPQTGAERLNNLRSSEFKDIDVIVLGINEALSAPTKEQLFSALERAGVNRTIAEHEARTLVLSGRLTDVGGHFIPTNKALAQEAMNTEVVTNILLEII